MEQSQRAHTILAVSARGDEERGDVLAVEEPLEIRLSYTDAAGTPIERPLSITMRTPGEDVALALGYVRTEGVVTRLDQLLPVAGTLAVVDEGANTATITLRHDVAVAWSRLERATVTTGACGMCGKTSLDAVRTGPYGAIEGGRPTVARSVIAALPDRVRALQRSFATTGGLHASALCAADGTVLTLAEDVGRHNALDKVIGHAFMREALPLRDQLVVLSGRASFELVQKSAMAGIAFVVAVGAPSTAAVALADELGMTLIGFARGDRFNVYTGRERVEPPRE